MCMMESDAVSKFERSVRSAVESAGLSGQHLVLAVSGGPDSLAMLYALHRLRHELGLTLHAAHLDHRIRGQESAADAKFVREVCETLQIDCTVEKARPRESPGRLSEDAARNLRYQFLARTAKRLGARFILLGHTLDDHVETVLIHLIRGSGLRGLRGILQSSDRRIDEVDVTLVRPLLHLSKRDTIDYCAARNLHPRIDPSNLSTELTRNKVRLTLMPLLEEINPSVKDALLRLSMNAADAVSILDGAVDAAWSAAVAETSEGVYIDREQFRALDDGVQTLLVIRALTMVGGTPQGIERRHAVEAVRSIMELPHGELHLPNAIRLSSSGSAVILSTKDASAAGHQAPSIPLSPLAVPGVTILGGWKVSVFPTVDTAKRPCVGAVESSRRVLVERFGRGVDVSTLAMRTRAPGDRFHPLGMSGTKKLKDFMIDEKIPRGSRDGVPLIVTSRGIAWVVGRRIAEWAKVADADTECVEIRVEETD